MDDIRFDHLSRRLASRRATLGGVLGGALLLGTMAESEAKKKKKKKKKKSFCEVNPNDTECNSGTTGRCLNGTCNPQPSCDIAGSSCSSGSAGTCCSQSCADLVDDAGNCAQGAAGAVCYTGADCQSGTCVGYRCR